MVRRSLPARAGLGLGIGIVQVAVAVLPPLGLQLERQPHRCIERSICLVRVPDQDLPRGADVGSRFADGRLFLIFFAVPHQLFTFRELGDPAIDISCELGMAGLDGRKVGDDPLESAFKFLMADAVGPIRAAERWPPRPR